MQNTKSSVWIITDDKPGHENQSRAVALHLGYSADQIFKLNYGWDNRVDEFCFRLRTSMIPTRILPHEIELQIKGKSAPNLIVSTGTLCAAINVALSQRYYSKNLVIMRPSFIPLNKFRAVLLPAHDINFNEPENVIETPLPPAYMDQIMISNQLEQLTTQFPIIKENHEFIAVLIGGSSKHAVFDEAYSKSIALHLLSIMQTNSCLHLLITSSRRTGCTHEQIFRNILTPVSERVHGVWASETKFNPIAVFCHLSKQVIVTSDSHSMIAEVVTSGHHPVLIDLPGKSTTKHTRFLAGFTQHKLGKVVIPNELNSETIFDSPAKSSLNPPPVWLNKVRNLI